MAYQKVNTLADDFELGQLLEADMLFSDELNEEDAQLKSELEMLVERLQVRLSRHPFCFVEEVLKVDLQEPDISLYKPALDAIKNFIKTSTSSMTAVPKPLKFLRPHYDELTAVYEKWPSGADKVSTVVC